MAEFKPLTLEEMQGLFGEKYVVQEGQNFQIAIPQGEKGEQYLGEVKQFMEQQGIVHGDREKLVTVDPSEDLKAKVGQPDINAFAVPNDFMSSQARTKNNPADPMLHMNKSGKFEPNAQFIADALRHPKKGTQLPPNPLTPQQEPTPVPTVETAPAPAAEAAPPAERNIEVAPAPTTPSGGRDYSAVLGAYMKGVEGKHQDNAKHVKKLDANLQRNAKELETVLKATSLAKDGKVDLTDAEKLMAAQGAGRAALLLIADKHGVKDLSILANADELKKKLDGNPEFKADMDKAVRKIGRYSMRGENGQRVADPEKIAKSMQKMLAQSNSRRLALQKDGKGEQLLTTTDIIQRAQERIVAEGQQPNTETPSREEAAPAEPTAAAPQPEAQAPPAEAVPAEKKQEVAPAAVVPQSAASGKAEDVVIPTPPQPIPTAPSGVVGGKPLIDLKVKQSAAPLETKRVKTFTVRPEGKQEKPATDNPDTGTNKPGKGASRVVPGGTMVC